MCRASDSNFAVAEVEASLFCESSLRGDLVKEQEEQLVINPGPRLVVLVHLRISADTRGNGHAPGPDWTQGGLGMIWLQT